MVPALAHLQRTDPRGFHVAVRDGRVVAFASTILRGNTHFLSMFWALPSLQSKGVGRKVLTRAFEGPRPPATAVRCVFASLDTRAQALYLKFGMCPARDVLHAQGSAEADRRARGGRVELVPIGEVGRTSREMLAVAARFDRTFRAARRDADIRFVMTPPGRAILLVRARPLDHRVRGGQREGTRGSRRASWIRATARASPGRSRRAARGMGAENIVIVVPGVNAGALDVFFRAGLRTEFFGAWMSAKPIGSFESYLLAGGMLL